MKKIKPSYVLILLGALLCVIAAVLILWQGYRAEQNSSLAEKTVSQLNGLIPDKSEWTPDDYSDKRYVCAEVDSNNYIGLLECSKYNVCLPVLSSQNEKYGDALPYRYSGESYDDSLIIGGTDRNGQLDFLREIELNDVITVTDMHGYRRSYAVTSIDKIRNVDKQTLLSDSSELTLFAKSYWSAEYIIVRCSGV